MFAGGANADWFVTTQDTNQYGSDLRKEDKLKAPNPYGEGAFFYRNSGQEQCGKQIQLSIEATYSSSVYPRASEPCTTEDS